MTSQVLVDQTDIKMLRILLKDARTSFSDIAKSCNLSTNAIVKRYERLKENQVIVGTSLLVRLDDFGYKFIVSIDMNVDVNKEAEITKVIKELPNFYACSSTVGKYDMHAVILARNFDEINEVRDILKKQRGIKRIKITANVDKIFYFPENILIEPTVGM